MRYGKGTIQLSPVRDIPLLQQILRSGFATSDQLYEFMQLNRSERSRQAFDHRLRRLLAHGLIEKHQGSARGRAQVYVISREGASLLIDMGELFAGRIDIRSPWKADAVQVVAFSEHADEQEAMLLMPAYSWVRGELGTFYVEPTAKQFWSAELRLERAGIDQ